MPTVHTTCHCIRKCMSACFFYKMPEQCPDASYTSIMAWHEMLVATSNKHHQLSGYNTYICGNLRSSSSTAGYTSGPLPRSPMPVE